MNRAVFVTLLALFASDVAWAQETERQAAPQLSEARSEVYKRVSDTELKVYVFGPEGHRPTDKRPAIIFFFGGGWKSGSPQQFASHCQYLASRGMVAMAADYRVHSRQQARVVDCVADAKSAIRWVRRNAARLGVDPDRIVSAGGSAGGHLACAVATLSGFDEPGEDTAVSCRPNAMILFNPALDLTAAGFNAEAASERMAELHKRIGAAPEDVSPTHHVEAGVPPTLVLHGKADVTVPFAQVEKFAARMKVAGNRCEVAGYDGAGHGFFNFGRDGNRAYVDTVRRADEFLKSLGYLEGEPTIGK